MANIKLELYDSTRTYMYPNSQIAPPEKVKEDYPAVAYFPHVIEVSGNTLQGIFELWSMRAQYEISELLENADAVIAIQDKINAARAAAEAQAEVPTANERIAAALELQNLLAM